MEDNILNRARFRYINVEYLNKHTNKLVIKNTPNGVKVKANINEKMILVPNKKYIGKMNYSVESFLSTMVTKCKNFNPSIFSKNFSHAKFNYEYGKSESFRGNINYKFVKGKRVVSLYANSCNFLSHEYLHMSNTECNSNECRSGFHTIKYFEDDDYLNIGVGINEGYTEVINQRYFKTSDNSIYYFQVRAAKILEKIIGKDIMEQAYFNLSLDTIIVKLCDYGNTREDVENFLLDLDLIKNINFVDTVYSEKLIPEFQSKITEIYKFLWKTFNNKLNSIDDYDEKLRLFDVDDWYTDMKFQFMSSKIKNEYVNYEFKLLNPILYERLLTQLEDEYNSLNKKVVI